MSWEVREIVDSCGKEKILIFSNQSVVIKSELVAEDSCLDDSLAIDDVDVLCLVCASRALIADVVFFYSDAFATRAVHSCQPSVRTACVKHYFEFVVF